jgi:hypothetical protein
MLQLRRLLLPVTLILTGTVLEALELWIYPYSLVNSPSRVTYAFHFLYFIRTVSYPNGKTVSSPAELDYLQLFSLVAVFLIIIDMVREKARRRSPY